MHRVQVVLVVGAVVPLLLAACGGGAAKDKEPVQTWSLSGTITGDAVERVVLLLGGDSSAQTESNAGGTYIFPAVLPGTYSVTPQLTNVTFVPPNRIVTVTNDHVFGVDFTSSGTPPLPDDAPPATPLRLVFVAHVEGTNWLDVANGALGDELGTNNYYVRDVSFTWSATLNPGIGSQTDIGHWYTWFADTTVQANTFTVRDNICDSLYTTTSMVASYTPIADPGGENDIVVVMSSFPNSAVQSDNGQPPSALYGQPAVSPAHTLPNCQDVYRKILEYFKTRTDKLFVIVTAPPLVSSETLLTEAANARSLNNWLVHNWLSEGSWVDQNVAVFDFYNVLSDVNNHHRFQAGVIEHIASNGDNFAAYGTGTDSTPTQLGNVKARAEFVPLLNVAYNRWRTAFP